MGAFIATVFGAVAVGDGERKIPGFGGGLLHMEGPKSWVQQGRCRTFAYWAQDDAEFIKLASDIRSDFGSEISCFPKCYRRPASISKLSDRGLMLVRHSPFLFVRKFAKSFYNARYAQLV